MKKLALIAAASFAAFGSALAADLPSRKAPPPYVPPAPLPPPPPMWTGLYGGLNIGGAWAAHHGNPNRYALFASPVTGDLYALPSNAPGHTAAGVAGGGQIGFNYQLYNSFLVGLETDIQGTSMRAGGSPNNALYPDPLVAGGFLTPLSPGNPNVALNWFGTARGRAGLLVAPTLLLYGTGGFAYGGVQGGYANNVRMGWTAGGGAEWLFTPNWSTKVEYLFTDLESGGAKNWSGQNWSVQNRPQFNVVRAGLNYHFNFGGAPTPVAAGY